MTIHIIDPDHTREVVEILDYRPFLVVAVLDNGEVIDAHPADLYVAATA